MAELAIENRDPYAIPLDELDPSDPLLFHRDVHWLYFKRLRDECPVHYVAESPAGPYWAITRYKDILEVDSNHKIFSSRNAITIDETAMIGTANDSTVVGGFLAMDPPEHDTQRRSVAPALAPTNIVDHEALIRERTRAVLDSLPIGEEFDWVERVSAELTLLMLATLFDFPLDERAKLKYWSDIGSGAPGDGNVESWEQREQVLREMATTFLEMREERRHKAEGTDIISMLVHSPLARGMSAQDFISNVALLITGGNDTTRNSMSGSIIAFNKFPDQWDKLIANPQLVDSLVPEIIRWQSPVLYQGRRALQDYELGGKTIRKGDKVIMWYVSGNRDERMIENPDSFIIDRERPRQHMSFGFGIHRCLGNRLAEMQLRVLWEEIIRKGWSRIEMVGRPFYAISNILRGIDALPVRIHA
jgi:cytochrome P450